MKPKLLLPAIFLAIVSCAQNNNKNVKPPKNIFDIKAAKIVFNYTGGPETGTETLYFDDYGNTAVLVVNKKNAFGPVNQTITWKDKKGQIIDHTKKTVSKSFFRAKATEPPGIADIDDKTKNNIGYEKLADATIAGKACHVWFNKKLNIKYFLWNKLDLKLENQGVYTKEATSAEVITEIPASLMEIPKDYKQ
ncbi:MAG TPA: hypothetical protein VI461_15105 [Chitinophagaceae bacterium]|nr:hypothetical protein [Chitinophagaceae bacterium]